MHPQLVRAALEQDALGLDRQRWQGERFAAWRLERIAREGLAWSIVWMTLAFAFSGFIYGAYEHKWLGLGLQK